MTEEIWIPIQGFSMYEASTNGRIRSMIKFEPAIIKAEIDKDGYHQHRLKDDDGVMRKISAHRIVAMAFNGEPFKDGLVVCHNDGIRSNNVPDNVRWATQKENIHDKIAHGTWQQGNKHPNSKITEDIAREIKGHLLNGMRPRAVSEMTGISHNIVWDISRGKTWRHV